MNNTLIFNGTVTDDLKIEGVTLIIEGMIKTCENSGEILLIKGIFLGIISTSLVFLLIKILTTKQESKK